MLKRRGRALREETQMKWTDLTSNWAASLSAVKRRFPLIEVDDLPQDSVTQDDFISAIAHRHDLTTREAEEEIRDLALVSALARRSTELQQD